MRTGWLSQAGLILCAVYLVLATPLLLLWYFTDNVKASFTYGSLAVFPAGVLLAPFRQAVMDWPWLNTFPGMFLLNIVLFYGIGCFITLVLRKLEGSA